MYNTLNKKAHMRSEMREIVVQSWDYIIFAYSYTHAQSGALP